MNTRFAACLLSLFLFHLAGCQPAADKPNDEDSAATSASTASPASDSVATTDPTDEPAAASLEPVNVIPTDAVAAERPPFAETEREAADVAEAQDETMEFAVEQEADQPPLPLLEIGAAAPELRIASWIQGEEVTTFPTDRVTVVEFWATWCPPCKASMPHLSQLQEKYQGDAVFIGVSDEPEETVTEFLGGDYDDQQTWNDVVNYRIAVDDDEATSTAYLVASRAPGIPTAFVVGREGILEWIGHPMSIDEPLKKIVAGTWDRDYELAMQRDLKQLQEAMQSQPAEAVLALIEGMVDKYPESHDLPFVRFRYLMQLERWDDARQLMEQFAADYSDKPELIHAMAWICTTTDDPSILESAQRLAEGLNEHAEQKDFDILDTLARIHFRRGHLDEAIRLQEQALEVNGRPDPRLQKSLDEYKKALEDQTENSEQT